MYVVHSNCLYFLFTYNKNLPFLRKNLKCRGNLNFEADF